MFFYILLALGGAICGCIFVSSVLLIMWNFDHKPDVINKSFVIWLAVEILLAVLSFVGVCILCFYYRDILQYFWE